MKAGMGTNPKIVLFIKFDEIQEVLLSVGVYLLGQGNHFPVVAGGKSDLSVVCTDPGNTQLINGDGLDMS